MAIKQAARQEPSTPRREDSRNAIVARLLARRPFTYPENPEANETRVQ